MKAHLEVGYVARPHGICGDVMVRTYDPASQALYGVDRVWVSPRDGSPRELRIETVRDHQGDLLVGFEGVLSREASEALTGATVAVFRSDLSPPEPGEYFQGDLVGLLVFSPEGAPIGRVKEVWSTGPVPNLVIETEGEELMVPFAAEFVPAVDLEQGRLTLIVPEVLE